MTAKIYDFAVHYLNRRMGAAAEQRPVTIRDAEIVAAAVRLDDALATARQAIAVDDESKRLAAVRAAHWQGSKYERGRDLKLVASDLRRDIAAARHDGELPEGLRVSVRISRYSMGQSLDLTITGSATNVSNPARLAWTAANPHACRSKAPPDGQPHHSAEIGAAMAKLEELANAYIYDRSDTLTDYFDSAFCLSVTVDGALERAHREALGY